MLYLTIAFAALLQDPTAPARDLAHDAYRAQMAAAESALRLGDHTEARAWLDATDPLQRGIEWRLFDAEFDAAAAHFMFDSDVVIVRVSPDGSRIACGRADGVLELRELPSFELRKSVPAHTAAITQVRFDREGARLVSCSLDRKVKVFDATQLQPLFTFEGHGYPVGGADFSRDGTLIASCSYERPEGSVVGTLHLWNATDGTIVRTLHGGRKPLVGLAFSPDGKRVAAGSWDFCAFVWSVDGGEPIAFRIPDDGVYNAVDGVAWSPDGRWLAAASKDSTARIFDTGSAELVATLRGHTDAVAETAFAPDGETIATASADGTVKLWDMPGGKLRATLRGHSSRVADLDFTPDGTNLWTCAHDRSVRTFDLRTAWFDGARTTASHATYVVRFSPGGERLASASYDGRVSVFSTATLDLLSSWQAHPQDKSCHMLAWSPDGRLLYSGSYDGTVAIWDSVTHAELARLTHETGLYWLAIDPTGERLAVVSQNDVHVWDLPTRERVSVFRGHTSSVLTVNWSSDGTRCVSCGRDGKAIVFDAQTGDVRCTAEGVGDEVAEAAFVARDTAIVVGGRDGRVALFDAASGAKLRDLVNNRHGFDHLAVSPDGTRLVLASEAMTFVDLARGGIVGRLRPHHDRTFHVAFDRTGDRLASCSTDRSIVIHDPRPLRERLADRERMRALRTKLGQSPERPDPATVFTDPSLDAQVRAAWIEVLTLRAAN